MHVFNPSDIWSKVAPIYGWATSNNGYHKIRISLKSGAKFKLTGIVTNAYQNSSVQSPGYIWINGENTEPKPLGNNNRSIYNLGAKLYRGVLNKKGRKSITKFNYPGEPYKYLILSFTTNGNGSPGGMMWIKNLELMGKIYN